MKLPKTGGFIRPIYSLRDRESNDAGGGFGRLSHTVRNRCLDRICIDGPVNSKRLRLSGRTLKIPQSVRDFQGNVKGRLSLFGRNAGACCCWFVIPKECEGSRLEMAKKVLRRECRENSFLNPLWSLCALWRKQSFIGWASAARPTPGLALFRKCQPLVNRAHRFHIPFTVLNNLGEFAGAVVGVDFGAVEVLFGGRDAEGFR
jgi:hypothetical protein